MRHVVQPYGSNVISCHGSCCNQVTGLVGSGPALFWYNDHSGMRLPLV